MSILLRIFAVENKSSLTYFHTLSGQLGHVSITTPNLNINLEPHPAANLGITI